MILQQRLLKFICDKITLKNYTILTADNILRCKKFLFPIADFRATPQETVILIVNGEPINSNEFTIKFGTYTDHI